MQLRIIAWPDQADRAVAALREAFTVERVSEQVPAERSPGKVLVYVRCCLRGADLDDADVAAAKASVWERIAPKLAAPPADEGTADA